MHALLEFVTSVYTSHAVLIASPGHVMHLWMQTHSINMLLNSTSEYKISSLHSKGLLYKDIVSTVNYFEVEIFICFFMKV